MSESFSLVKQPVEPRFQPYMDIEDLIWSINEENCLTTINKIVELVPAENKHLFLFALFTASKVWKRRPRQRSPINVLIESLQKSSSFEFYKDFVQELRKALQNVIKLEEKENSDQVIQFIKQDNTALFIVATRLMKLEDLRSYLKYAIRYGSANIFKFIASNCGSINLSEYLKDAIKGGNQEIVTIAKGKDSCLKPYLKTAIKYHQTWIIDKILTDNQIKEYKDISIALCIENAYLRVGYYLMNQGFDLEESYRDEKHLTICCRITIHPMIEILLEKGVKASTEALSDAARRNDIHIFNKLLEYGADPNEALITDQYLPNPICSCIEKKYDKILEKVLDTYDPNVNKYPITPISLAFAYSNQEVLENIISKNLSVKPAIDDKPEFEYPIHVAARMIDLKYVNMLIQRKVDINVVNPVTGETPLIAAISLMQSNTAEILLNNGADPEIIAKYTRHSDWPSTALSIAFDMSKHNLISKILSVSNNFNAIDFCAITNQGDASALQIITSKFDGMNEVVKKSRNLSENTYENIKTPFTMALVHNKYAFAKKCIELGGDVTTKRGGLTPLGFCCMYNFMESCRALIDSGVPISSLSERVPGYFEFPIEISAAQGYTQLFQYLCGVYVTKCRAWEVKNPNIFLQAIAGGHLELIRILILLKFGMNTVSKHVLIRGKPFDNPVTPLFVAINFDNYDIARLLIAFGATMDEPCVNLLRQKGKSDFISTINEKFIMSQREKVTSMPLNILLSQKDLLALQNAKIPFKFPKDIYDPEIMRKEVQSREENENNDKEDPNDQETDENIIPEPKILEEIKPKSSSKSRSKKSKQKASESEEEQKPKPRRGRKPKIVPKFPSESSESSPEEQSSSSEEVVEEEEQEEAEEEEEEEVKYVDKLIESGTSDSEDYEGSKAKPKTRGRRKKAVEPQETEKQTKSSKSEKTTLGHYIPAEIKSPDEFFKHNGWSLKWPRDQKLRTFVHDRFLY